MQKYRRHAEHARMCRFAAAAPIGLALALTGCGAEEIVPIDSESFAMPTEEVVAQDSGCMNELVRSEPGPLYGFATNRIDVFWNAADGSLMVTDDGSKSVCAVLNGTGRAAHQVEPVR